jgi:hypothetical protein
MSYQRDASMEGSIFASFPILAVRHASMLVLATGFIPCLLHKTGSRCGSPLARMICSSTSPLWHPPLTASQTISNPSSSSSCFSSLLRSCSPAIHGEGWFRSRVGFSRARGRQSVRATSESARRHQRMDALLAATLEGEKRWTK